MRTASTMTSSMTLLSGRLLRCENSRQAKSVCRPSSREMSSLEKVRPGIRPRFFIQKTEAKAPLKKMPSTAAKATSRWAKVDFLVGDPPQGPVGLLADAGDCEVQLAGWFLLGWGGRERTGVDGVEEVGAFGRAP